MAKAQTLINVGGQTFAADSVKLPATGRQFREAWVKNGDVIEVDMAVARTIRIGQLVAEAAQEAEKADRQAKIFAAQGDNASATGRENRASRLRGKPSTPAVNAIQNATTPEELAAVTLDDFLP